MRTIITLKDLSFSYQETPILENVSIDIEHGEFIGIFGPNGGGKTTLLKLLMGLLQPSAGTISLFDHPPSTERRRLAYVPQSLKFDRQFPISVFELIVSGRLSHLPWYGRYAASDLELAEEMLERVGLKDQKHRAFGTLSGGQAQRALIARALVSQPEILLLDEPTASVDYEAENEIYALLEGLRRKVTILMVTHHLHTAIDQVDRVLLVRKNVISLKPEEVCEHFAVGLYHPPIVQLRKKGAHDTLS